MKKEGKDELVAEVVRRVLKETGNASGREADLEKAAARKSFGKISREENPGISLQPQITLRLAVVLIERIERRAEELGMRIVAAVSDAAGRPVAIHCMDGAYIGSFDVALNKAYTAIAFQMSTARLGELAAPGQPLYGIQQTNEGRIVIFGGGEPLTVRDLGAGDRADGGYAAGGSHIADSRYTADGRPWVDSDPVAGDASGRIIGAVGVSGGTAEQDTYLAAYARSIVKEVVSCL